MDTTDPRVAERDEDPCERDLYERDLYERDFYTWTQRQAKTIRDGRLAEVDWANIAEEIETLGRSEVSELRSRYKVLCLHLLKKIVQPERDDRSCTTTIVDQRDEIARHLADNPGLKPKKVELFAAGYAAARKLAASETERDLAAFSVAPPFTMAQAESEDWWPEAGFSADPNPPG